MLFIANPHENNLDIHNIILIQLVSANMPLHFPQLIFEFPASANPVSIFSPPPASYVPANTTQQQQQQLHQNNRYVTFVTTPPPTSASSVSASTTTAASTNNNGINQQGVLPQLSSVSSQIQPITTSGPPPLRIISHPPEIKRSKNRAQTRTTLVSLTRS